MDNNAFSYLMENKEKYPKDILIEKLRSAGYLERDIMESVMKVYGTSDTDKKTGLDSPTSKEGSFWDFKGRKSYNSGMEKIWDFLFGFFAPWLVGIIAGLIPIVGPMVALAFFIYALIYLFNRRRFIVYGMLAETVVSLLVLVILISVLFSYGLF